MAAQGRRDRDRESRRRHDDDSQAPLVTGHVRTVSAGGHRGAMRRTQGVEAVGMQDERPGKHGRRQVEDEADGKDHGREPDHAMHGQMSPREGHVRQVRCPA